MSCCCNGGDDAAPALPAPAVRWLTRLVGLTQWALPMATLALVPKCPGCIAGYVLVFTGMGISFTAAATARWALIGISVSALAYLLIRAARRALT